MGDEMNRRDGRLFLLLRRKFIKCLRLAARHGRRRYERAMRMWEAGAVKFGPKFRPPYAKPRLPPIVPTAESQFYRSILQMDLSGWVDGPNGTRLRKAGMMTWANLDLPDLLGGGIGHIDGVLQYNLY
jgi:hypothetical protein